MSNNRTRWLDKLRPAGASSGGWTEGPMAPVETTDAATVDQRCSFKHWARWRHNHTQNCVSPCAWVKLIVSRIVVFAQGPCFLHEQISSNSICACHPRARGHEFFTGKKNDPNLCVSSLCKPYFRIIQKKNYPSQVLTVILVQGPCSNIQSHTVFVQKPCNSVQKKKLRHPCAGALQQCPAENKASSSIRSSYLRTSIVGIVSPLVNTTSGLSGGRRGGDVSGAASAPSLVDARLFARALALDLACGICCPPFFIRKGYASDGSSTPRRKSSAMR